MPTAEQIKAARERLGLSQAAAAAQLGANIRTYQRWEAGDNAPTGLYARIVTRWIRKAEGGSR